MRKSITIIIVLAFLLACPAVAFADAWEYVFDHNDYMTIAEAEQLNELAADIYNSYGFDILLDMDDTVTQNAVSYAEQRYAEENGAANGILLAITEDKWYIHREGDAKNVFSDADIDYLWDAYNVEETYFGGVESYILAADEMLKLYYSSATSADTPVIPQTRQKPRLVDEAGLLSATEREELLAKLDEISERQACDVAIVTVNSLGNKTAEAYADDYYDYNGYGMGNGDDGILLLISMENRDWAITTYGFAIPAFTDAGQEYMVDRFRPHLSDGNYAAAFNLFAELCDDYLLQAKTDKPYDGGNEPEYKSNLANSMKFFPYFFSNFTFLLPICFIASLAITFFMKRSLKSVAPQRAASSYVRNDSVRITDKRDIFLYKTVSKTARESESSSSGGSSTHSSSSGRSHGGSSGSF